MILSAIKQDPKGKFRIYYGLRQPICTPAHPKSHELWIVLVRVRVEIFPRRNIPARRRGAKMSASASQPQNQIGVTVTSIIREERQLSQ